MVEVLSNFSCITPSSYIGSYTKIRNIYSHIQCHQSHILCLIYSYYNQAYNQVILFLVCRRYWSRGAQQRANSNPSGRLKLWELNPAFFPKSHNGYTNEDTARTCDVQDRSPLLLPNELKLAVCNQARLIKNRRNEGGKLV